MKLPFEKKYFKNLDALRGIAALMVVFCHFSIDFHYDHSKLFDFIETIADFNGSGGTLAVRFFFILSGFLITFLLFEEKSATNHVNIKNFFARRIFRIWPLYFLILIIGFFIYPEISKVFSGSHTENASLLYYSLFLANLDQIYHHNTPSGILSILWSLSVEEQFYIIWPFLIYFMSNKKRSLFWFLILIVLFAATFIYANSSRYEVQRIHTISSFLELGTGALVAYLVFNFSEQIKNGYEKTLKLSSYSFFAYIAGLIIVFIFTKMNKTPIETVFIRTSTCLFFGFIIIDQTLNTFAKIQLSRLRVISTIGKFSYGIYMYHMIPITILKFISNKYPSQSFSQYFMYLLATIIFTIAISYFSYKYFESFFLRLKNKFNTLRNQ